MDKVLSTEHFIDSLLFEVDEYTKDSYLNELMNFNEVMVDGGVDCFYLWQHLEAFKRALSSLDYSCVFIVEAVK